MTFTRHHISALLALTLAGCGDSPKDSSPEDILSRLGDAGLAGDGSTSDGAMRDGGRESNSDGGRCAKVRAFAELLPVHLAFAFDVSGSMGQGDYPWHSKSLKWDPVVAATRAFFEAGLGADQMSSGLTASLTFFPSASNRCEEDSYTTPDVPMTRLPSLDFGEAIRDVEPEGSEKWRSNTPTLFALRGTHEFVEAYRADHPGKYAIVMVTDGYPQGCTGNNDIAKVANEATQVHAAGIPVYVIGVKNPDVTGAPENVTLLSQVAVAGGTEQAYLIDTGDPGATSDAFSAAIQRIREASVSCNLKIPPAPDGRPFDKLKVQVTATPSTGPSQDLEYDATCANAHAWRYDDENAPTEVMLCPNVCSALEGDPNASISIDFACEDVIVI